MDKYIYIFIQCLQCSTCAPLVQPFTSLSDAIAFKFQQEGKLREHYENETVTIGRKEQKTYSDVKIFNTSLATDRSQLVAYHYLRGREVIDFYIIKKQIL